MPTGIAVMLERRKRRPVRLWDIVELIFEFIVQILQMQVAGGINNVNGRISGCAVGPGLTGPGAHLSRVCEFFKRDIFSPFVSGSCEEGSKSGGASGGSFLQDAPPRSWGSPMTGRVRGQFSLDWNRRRRGDTTEGRHLPSHHHTPGASGERCPVHSRRSRRSQLVRQQQRTYPIEGRSVSSGC